MHPDIKYELEYTKLEKNNISILNINNFKYKKYPDIKNLSIKFEWKHHIRYESLKYDVA